jgi:hypothetical protein
VISTGIARKLGAIPEQIRRKSRTNPAEIARESFALEIACFSNRYRFVLFFAWLAHFGVAQDRLRLGNKN